MPSVTTAYVKNIIRRGFSELVDPSPKRDTQTQIWAHFESSCAFCGRKLDRQAEEGRIDHLLAASKGGANALGNRVLSCATCNDKEKLDEAWETFLSKKASGDEVGGRRARILEWQRLHPLPSDDQRELRQEAAERAAADVVRFFEEKVKEIRLLLYQ